MESLEREHDEMLQEVAALQQELEQVQMEIQEVQKDQVRIINFNLERED
jgi:prefoldin subunit 5